MAPYNKPRVVEERSPWGEFFSSLPDTVLSFMQLQHQIKFKAEEAEKARQFSESQLYLKDLMNTKQLLHKSVLDSKKIAQAKGLSFEVAFSKLDPSTVTSGAPEATGNYMNILQQEINQFESADASIGKELQFAGLGAQHAMEIDADFSGLIDTDELTAYQKANPELLEQLGLPEFPKSYIEGAKNWLTQPKVRKQQQENKVVNARLNILKGWDLDPTTENFELDPNDVRFSDQEKAVIAFQIDPTSSTVTTHITNALSAEADLKPFKLYGQTWTSVGSGYASTPAGQKEIEAGTIVQHPDKYRGMWFRTEYPAGTSGEQKKTLNQRKDLDKHYTGLQNNLRGIAKKASDNFNEQLAWDPNLEELHRADTFHELGPTHRENIAKNFATWFSQKTEEGNDADNNAPGWMERVFYANGGWEDVEMAVTAVMDDLRFDRIISDPAVLKETFNWTGSEYKEDAANEFFMRSYEMFNLTEQLGRDLDYSFMKGVSKVGEIDSTIQGDLDILKGLIPGGNK